MIHLAKLAQAIVGANSFLKTVKSQELENPANSAYSFKEDTLSGIPTKKEQDRHESGISFKDKTDLSSNPSSEYLD
tara:strand:- start:66 stop:293 length:228 start_codon:yes stop_codon:yes gene_type:complete